MFVFYFLVGAFAGTMSGLLGIGGGIIVIPSLVAIFTFANIIPSIYIMHMAIGTSLAIVIMTSISGLYAYQKRGSVRWDIVKKIAPTLIAGVLLGVVIADSLSSFYLKKLFGIFLFLISLKFLLDKSKKEFNRSLSTPMMWFFSFVIGILCSILGLGGGVMLMPFLLHCQIEILKAAGTSLACGMMVGIIATISFMLTPSASGLSIPFSTGYIYWPAFLGVAVASMMFAPFGTYLAHKLPSQILKKIFAVILMVVAVDMSMSS